MSKSATLYVAVLLITVAGAWVGYCIGVNGPGRGWAKGIGLAVVPHFLGTILLKRAMAKS